MNPSFNSLSNDAPSRRTRPGLAILALLCLCMMPGAASAQSSLVQQDLDDILLEVPDAPNERFSVGELARGQAAKGPLFGNSDPTPASIG